jgi:ABC-type polysaccharide/polyol phosphate export systems, permease component
LIYLGGIFYSIEILSDQWQFISKLNPILYVVDFFRYAMLGTYQINPFGAFALISGFTASFFALAYYLLHKGIGVKE